MGRLKSVSCKPPRADTHTHTAHRLHLHMSLLHSTFTPHTYQLHSISCSAEAEQPLHNHITQRLQQSVLLSKVHTLATSQHMHITAKRKKKKSISIYRYIISNSKSWWVADQYQSHRTDYAWCHTAITSITSIHHHPQSVLKALQLNPDAWWCWAKTGVLLVAGVHFTSNRITCFSFLSLCVFICACEQPPARNDTTEWWREDALEQNPLGLWSDTMCTFNIFISVLYVC